MADEFHLVEKSRIMDNARMKRALSRLASEIVEENQGAKDLYIVGIRRRGVPLAERIVDKIEAIEGDRPQYGIIDITLYRDDLSTVGANPIVNRTELPGEVQGRRVLSVMIGYPAGAAIIGWLIDQAAGTSGAWVVMLFVGFGLAMREIWKISKSGPS
jgi:hypothetical protein